MTDPDDNTEPNTLPEEDFWPDLFEVDGILNVRLSVFVMQADDDGDKSIEDIKADAAMAAAEARTGQIEKYASALDTVSMDLTFEQIKLFIAHYATYHSVKRAAREAGASVAAIRHRRKIDPIFDEMWVMARENWVDDLEEQGMARATEEVESRYSGPSNDMLKFMLKGESARHQETVNVRHGGIEGAPPVRTVKQFGIEHLEDTVKVLSEVLDVGGS